MGCPRPCRGPALTGRHTRDRGSQLGVLLIGDEASAGLTAVWQLQSRDAAMMLAGHHRAMDGQPPDDIVEAHPLSSKQQRAAATGKLTDALRAELGLSLLAEKRPKVGDDDA